MATSDETFNLAWQHHQAGRFAEAESLYQEIVRADSSHADAWCFLGAVCQAQGKLPQAESSLRQAIRLSPHFASAWNYLGIVLAQQGRPQEAAASFQELLVHQPDDVDGYNNLGLIRAQLGQFKEAIACYRRALQLKPGFATAQGNLNHALQLQNAGAGPAQVAQPRSNSPELAYAANKRGVALAQQGRLDEANACFEEALQFEPANADAYSNLGTVLDIQHKYDQAVAHYRKALEFKPNHVEAHYNLGTVLDKQGKVEEAIASFRRTLALDPKHIDARNNLGNALKNYEHLDEAMVCFEHTLRLKPDYGEGHLSRAMVWLLRGDFERGWPEYEWRWKRAGYTERTFDKPFWDGSDLTGRTILLYAEQGLGDTLQFIRYAALVRQRGGKVIVECQPKMLALLTGVQGVDQWVAQGSPLPAFDVHAPLPSLASIFGTDLDTIPAEVPYLWADGKLVEQWAEELGSRLTPQPLSPAAGQRGVRVGIAWQGNPEFRDDIQRSIALTHFARLAEVPGVQLISLQKGHGTEQLRELAGKVQILDLGDRLDEASGAFMDTAAVMCNLDLVITSDTAIPHLAGALGVPVWVALPLVPDWRWLLQREDSPWYPTMRLFRQKRYGNWAQVFERMADELRTFERP